MKEVNIFTDGACLGNPGPGGWAAILIFSGKEKRISSGQKDTTNNRMELTAVIEALLALKEPCKVNMYTDSKYVCDAVMKGWAKNWKKRGWKKSDNKPALNSDLWEKLLGLLEINNVSFHWVKGHAGHPLNEKCDKLAVLEAKKMR